MSRFRRRNSAPVLGCAAALLLGAAANPVYAQQTLPNETPEKFVPRVESLGKPGWLAISAMSPRAPMC